MKDKTLSEGEVKARLAQAEAHFSHYRWDDAIALFEAVLASHPDHPLAAQGWAHVVEQKSVDEELKDAVAKARESLAARRFDEALALLNHAQTRGALSHILKHHSEIDGLRSEAQEGQEWQRRIDSAMREADALAARRNFDQALVTLDGTLRPLQARGWGELGAGLAALRDKLWSERDVTERVQFAQAAHERQDYRLATELAATLHEELPGRDDVRRLHERARSAWGRMQQRLDEVDAALAAGRTEDALALLAALRAEHPRNPDWQAVALRIYMDQGRAAHGRGRGAFAQQSFEAAAEELEAAAAAFGAIAEIFPEHPSAELERAESEALRQAALLAGQAARDARAFRWEASRQGWQGSREQLGRAAGARGRDFGEIAAAIDAGLGESESALADLQEAGLMLADGRQALGARDAGAAREAFRGGLSRIEGGRLGEAARVAELRAGLASGLREAERIQREVKKLLGQADSAADPAQRLTALRRAYERWETAPGLAARLAEELLAAASARAEAGDEDAALALCEQIGELTGAPGGALADAQRMTADISAQRAEKAARADAAEKAARAEAVEKAVRPVEDGLRAVEALCEAAADGDLAAVAWDEVDSALKQARSALRAATRSLPAPLPPRLEALRGRVEELDRRNQLLAATREQMVAGRGIDALPALQAHVAADPDPLVLAVLGRLTRESATDAVDAARSWQAEAAAALERGELSTAAACIALAQSYATAAPRIVPEIRRVERQIELLTQARDRTREARALAARGDLPGALSGYRSALELAADGESGLPAGARIEIHRILDREDAVGGEELPAMLLDDAGRPLVREFVAPALGRWWRLARQLAALAQVETHAALGREDVAAQVGAELAQAYPADRRLLEAYLAASARAAESEVKRRQRGLRRARNLAEQGAYAEAMAEMDRAPLGEPRSEEAEALAEEAADLRMSLDALARLDQQLAPLLEQMREAALAGQFEEALATGQRAEFLDPGRRARARWDEFDQLAGLIEKRQTAPARAAAARPSPRMASTAPEPDWRLAANVASADRGASSDQRAPNGNAAPPVEQPARRDVEAPQEETSPPTGAQFPASAAHRPADARPVIISGDDEAGESTRVGQQDRADAAKQAPVPGQRTEIPTGPSGQTEPPARAPEPMEPAPAFDLDDWLSNVTELGPEDAGSGKES
jgi:hypothetical protein